jgi:hypothetical protein
MPQIGSLWTYRWSVKWDKSERGPSDLRGRLAFVHLHNSIPFQLKFEIAQDT